MSKDKPKGHQHTRRRRTTHRHNTNSSSQIRQIHTIEGAGAVRAKRVPDPEGRDMAISTRGGARHLVLWVSQAEVGFSVDIQ